MISYLRSAELLENLNKSLRFMPALVLVKCSWHSGQILKYFTVEVWTEGIVNVNFGTAIFVERFVRWRERES